MKCKICGGKTDSNMDSITLESDAVPFMAKFSIVMNHDDLCRICTIKATISIMRHIRRNYQWEVAMRFEDEGMHPDVIAKITTVDHTWIQENMKKLVGESEKLHSHPTMEKQLGIPEGHVIIDGETFLRLKDEGY